MYNLRVVGNQDVWVTGGRWKTGGEQRGRGWDGGTVVGKEEGGVYNPGSRNVKLEGRENSRFIGIFVYLNGYRAHDKVVHGENPRQCLRRKV